MVDDFAKWPYRILNLYLLFLYYKNITIHACLKSTVKFHYRQQQHYIEFIKLHILQDANQSYKNILLSRIAASI